MSNKKIEPFIKGGKLGYSDAQVDALLSEVQDPERVTLFCGKHNYFADLLKPPLHNQCQECQQAYVTLMVGSMPPHVREEFTMALQEFAHRTVENPLGYVQFDHPEVKIDKGAI
jgi:hypothetical protein